MSIGASIEARKLIGAVATSGEEVMYTYRGRDMLCGRQSFCPFTTLFSAQNTAAFITMTAVLLCVNVCCIFAIYSV